MRNKDNFTANPGLGWVFKNATTPQGYGLWNGKLSLYETYPNKQPKQVSLQAVAIRLPEDATKAEQREHQKRGGDRYEFKMVAIGQKDEPWQYLGDFVLPAFGGRKSQIVDTPVGKMTVWLQQPRNKSDWSIRFRMLCDDKGVVRSARPM